MSRPLGVAVFLAGASALAFEVVLERTLRIGFGAESRAAAATFAAYMAGLAIGGPLGARLARTGRPALRWAAVEAVAALLFLACFLLEPGVRVLYASLGADRGGATLAVLRLALSFVSLLPATATSAAALPLALAALPESGAGRPSTSAALVSTNLAGAATGAAIASFAGIRILGMTGTAIGAAVLGVAAAAVATRTPATDTAREATPRAAKAIPRDLLFAALASGFSAISLEVVLLRIVLVHTTAGVYAFGLVLVTALAGLAIGGRIAAGRLAKGAKAADVLSFAVRAGGAAGLATVLFAPWIARFVVGDPNALFEASAAGLFAREAALAAGLLLPAFVVQGLAWPAAVAAVDGDPARTGPLVAANLGGAAMGALATGFVTLPLLGLRGAAATAAIAGALAGLVGSRSLAPRARARRAGAVGLLAAACLAAAAIPVRHLKEPGGDRVVFYEEGADAIVTVREGRAGRVLRVDGQTVASSFGAGVTDARMLAHLPLLLHPRPRRALTVGFGSGGTSRAMTLHDLFVDAVEIEPAVVDAADFFDDVNQDVLSDPRLRIRLEDARDWLSRTRIAYDVVASDCTNLQWGQNGLLYSREYWSIVRRRLAPGGFAVAWMPLGGIGRADLGTLVASFRAELPHATIHYFTNAVTNFFLLVGAPRRLEIDVDDVARRAAEPAVAADLQAIGLDDPYRIAASLLVGEDGVRRLARGATLHTDDRPLLDYRTPYRLFRPTAGPRLADLVAASRGAETQIVGGDPQRRLRAVLAERAIARGNAALLGGQVMVARDRYREAARLIPGDPAIRVLFEEAGGR